MADSDSDDWKNKVSDMAQKSKTRASKSLQSAKEGSKALISEGKSMAEKGIDKTQKSVKKAVKTTEEFVSSRRDKKNKPDKDVKNKSQKKSSSSVDYSKLKVSELKERLKSLNLKISGKKTELVERLHNYQAQPKADKSIKQVFIGTNPEFIRKDYNDNQPMEKGENSPKLHNMFERIKKIENTNPEVLLPLEPVAPKNSIYPMLLSTLLFYIAGISLMAYSILLLIPSINETIQVSFIAENLQFIEYLVPSWFSPDSMEPLPLNMHIPFVLIGSLVVFCSGLLIVLKKKRGVDFIISYFFGILIIGRVLYFFFSDLAFTSEIFLSLFNDILIAMIVSGLAITPLFYNPNSVVQTVQSRFFYTDIFAETPKEQYTGDDVERMIEEGLEMDIRANIVRPPQPRARAKFEPYEKLLLFISFGMWPLTIVMTFVYEGSLASMSDIQAGKLGLGICCAISLFLLIVLIRFDKAARSSGMYAKEKESYSGMMDLYIKAQEAHYEYVKLRAAAEAQQIIEKYPQLGPSKGNAKVAEA
jgi:hypothetical protein